MNFLVLITRFQILQLCRKGLFKKQNSSCVRWDIYDKTNGGQTELVLLSL